MFKVMIKHVIPPGKERELAEMITQLRIGASGQSGYISGETLRNASNPNEFLVVSVWDCEASWNEWFKSDERALLQKKVDDLCGAPTSYETYHYPHITHDD